MNPLQATLRRLGPAGARDNARQECENHRLANQRIEALGRRLAEQSARDAGPSARRRRSA